MLRIENWFRRFGGRLYAMVRDLMGTRMSSMFFKWERGMSLGGVAIVSCQMCWSSRAVGSCGWYWRWKKIVCSVLAFCICWRIACSSAERDMYANAFLVALRNNGVSVVV